MRNLLVAITIILFSFEGQNLLNQIPEYMAETNSDFYKFMMAILKTWRLNTQTNLLLLSVLLCVFPLNGLTSFKINRHYKKI